MFDGVLAVPFKKNKFTRLFNSRLTNNVYEIINNCKIDLLVQAYDETWSNTNSTTAVEIIWTFLDQDLDIILSSSQIIWYLDKWN